jgi:HPt (histidine-containing phosphotransfer) domain-containing protein
MQSMGVPIRESFAEGAGAESAVFDRAHLAHYTMNIAELEAEVIGLFLQQLPETLKALAAARSPAEWKLASHALKGACASIGAKKLHALAVQLESTSHADEGQIRLLRLKAVEAAAAEFSETVRPIYGQV